MNEDSSSEAVCNDSCLHEDGVDGAQTAFEVVIERITWKEFTQSLRRDGPRNIGPMILL